MKPKKQELIAKLQRENRELKAQLVSNHHFASMDLKKFTIDRCMGSAVILELTCLGGKIKIDPVAISDGLSDETIAALKEDLIRSYNKAVEFKP
jgi:hypothetical protein